MKFFAVFLFCLVACGSPALGGFIDSKIKDVIESVRDKMPEGFPSLGIPPLAPLEIKQKNIHLNLKNADVQVDLENLVVSGLNNFDIQKVKFNIFSKKFDLKFLFPQITANTDYVLNTTATKNNVVTTFTGNGSGSSDAKNIEVTVSGKVKLNLGKGKLQFKKLDVVIKAGDIVSKVDGLLVNGKPNEKLNNALENDLDNLLNDNQKKITKFIGTVVVDKINKILESKNLFDLMAKDSVVLEALTLISED